MDAQQPHWVGKHYSFYSNKECEFYPCHQLPEGQEFNCLFCYCPLYMLGRACGGNFKYLENGIKDCSGCTLPHRRENYGYISEKFAAITQAMAEQEKSGTAPDHKE